MKTIQNFGNANAKVLSAGYQLFLFLLILFTSCQTDDDLLLKNNASDAAVNGNSDLTSQSGTTRVSPAGQVAYTLGTYTPEELYISKSNALWAADYNDGSRYALNPDQPDMSAITSRGGLLYATTDYLYQIDPNTGMYSVYASLGSGWATTDALAFFSTDLYAINGGYLYKINTSTGTATTLGSYAWPGTQGLTALGSYLYAIQDGYLWRINPSTGTYVSVGGQAWSNTEGLITIGSDLYAVQDGYFWRINPNTGTYVSLGGLAWTGTKAMTEYGGNAYIVQDGYLWRVNPANGAYTRIGSTSWTGTTCMTALVN